MYVSTVDDETKTYLKLPDFTLLTKYNENNWVTFHERGRVSEAFISLKPFVRPHNFTDGR